MGLHAGLSSAVPVRQAQGRLCGTHFAIYSTHTPSRIRFEALPFTDRLNNAFRVDFVRPFVAHNVNEFVLEPSEPGTSTKVTWTMRGPNLFS